MLIVLFAAVAHGADVTPVVVGTLDGKLLIIPERRMADGVKVTVGLLESCSFKGGYQADELTKAEQGDHVRLVFPKPITVTVMGKKVEVSQLVVRLPLREVWARTGDKWERYTKYDPEKSRTFEAWLRQALYAE